MRIKVLAAGGAVFLVLGVAAHFGCSSTESAIAPAPEQDAGPDATSPGVCGNKIVEKGEDCDDGNKTNGDGCDNDCTFSCTAGTVNGDAKCDDKNACNGAEKCAADHRCTAGVPLKDGDVCGAKKICNAGACADVVCGDKIVSPPEECDDGNAISGDGCDSCKFSCVASDTTRDCTPADPCNGKGTCNDATHICAPGTPLGDGTGCGGGKVCKGGTCVSAACGDGLIEPPEQCDFGAGNGVGTGCELNCTFSCAKSPDSCVTADICAGTKSCTTVSVSGHSGQKCVAGPPPGDGTPCPNNGVCTGGICKTSLCGNGTLDPGEQCDFGAQNGPGTGCELSCQFSCTKSPNSCPNADPCNAQTQVCANVVVNNSTGQKCGPGTPLAACGACATGAVCVTGRCSSSICGDGCVDPAKGETCDPPGPTCDASCHAIVCGNGVREGSEDCDDGNVTNLDGCDSTCRFEHDQRANSVQMQFTTPTLCTANALGGAIASSGRGQLQTSLDTGVKSGATTISFKFLGLTDPTGTSQPQVELGGLGGAPISPAAPYDGTNDLDWWYTTEPTNIDASRNPRSRLQGAIVSKLLNASGTLDLSIALGGGTTQLHLTNTKLRANIGGTSLPLVSSGTTPGHRAIEHLNPTLQTFASMSAGELCGNISAASLANVPIPAALLSNCTQPYTAASSLLDVLVGGCSAIFGIPVVTATQPDQIDPAAPPAGAGPTYTLIETNYRVTSCRDRSGATVTLATCLTAAAYSSFFKFTTDRVIAK